MTYLPRHGVVTSRRACRRHALGNVGLLPEAEEAKSVGFGARKRRRPPRVTPGGLRCAIALGAGCLGLGLDGPKRLYVLVRRIRGGANVRRGKATSLTETEHRGHPAIGHVDHVFL